MNPYNFVPLGAPAPRRAAPGHLRLPTTGGEIRARLTTLGPFLIAKNLGGQQIVPLDGGKVIPGSSLKGMVRSVAEIVCGGCIRLSGSLFGRSGQLRRHVPRGFEPCTELRQLCPTCRMFGALDRQEAWRGLVRIGDGRLREGSEIRQRTLFMMVGAPKPEHVAFYLKNGALRGRKLYFHHPEEGRLITSAAPKNVAFGARQVIQVRALEPRLAYDFSVQHEGLDDHDYRLLLYALFLSGTEAMAHKLGWGKPMGLGSVRIEPLWIKREDLRRRYKEGTAAAPLIGEAAAEHVRSECRGIHERGDEVMAQLRAMLRYPEPAHRPKRWAYPDYAWFKANPQKTLEEFNQSHE